MPRVRLAVPAEQRKIEADLTEHCTGGARYADMTQIGRYLGIENRRIVAEFLDGLPCFQRGTKKARGRSGGTDSGGYKIGERTIPQSA